MSERIQSVLIKEFRGSRYATVNPGDWVICVRKVSGARGIGPAPQQGAAYKVSKITDSSHGSAFIWLVGFDDGWRAHNFETPTVDGTIDWQTSFHSVHVAKKATEKALDQALEREKKLQEHVKFLQDAHAEVTKENEKLGALRTAYDTLVNSQKVSTSVFDEHKRMKRQLELAESYNFDRDGVNDGVAMRDLYNYVLLALGKKPLAPGEWACRVINRALDRILNRKDLIWKTPIFNGHPVFHYPQPLNFIPISFVVTDEKHSHQSDAYSATGCAEGCSHPDCKKGNK